MLNHITKEQVNELKQYAEAEHNNAQRGYRAVCKDIAALEPTSGRMNEMVVYAAQSEIWGYIHAFASEIDEQSPEWVIDQIIAHIGNEYGRMKRQKRSHNSTGLMQNAIDAIRNDATISEIRRVVVAIVETADTTSAKSRREYQGEIEALVHSHSKTYGSTL